MSEAPGADTASRSPGHPGPPASRRLEAALGYEFKDPLLLHRALTHKSHYYENEAAPGHNERLEFLGDAVLGLLVTERLYEMEPRMSEAMMSKCRSHVVKGRMLAEVAEGLGLGGYLRLGRGEEATGGRRKRRLLANAMEAVIGAVYLDAGYGAARSLVRGLLGGRMEGAVAAGSLEDFKSELQELAQGRHGGPPEYMLLGEDGPDHDRTYTYGVCVAGREMGRGRARSKKAAQAEAAREALMRLSEFTEPGRL